MGARPICCGDKELKDEGREKEHKISEYGFTVFVTVPRKS